LTLPAGPKRDLVFVFASTQIATLVRHDVTVGGLFRGMLLLAMIYWAWSMFTWTGHSMRRADWSC